MKLMEFLLAAGRPAVLHPDYCRGTQELQEEHKNLISAGRSPRWLDYFE